MVEFKDRLKQLRKEKGLTQKELSIKLNTKASTISSWEQGVSHPQWDNLSKVSIGNYERGNREPVYSTVIGLAKFFDVSTDYLLGISDERKPTMIEKPIDLSVISTEELLKELHRRIS